MHGNQHAGAGSPQVLSLSAAGDIGPVARKIRSDTVANVKFVNDKSLAPTERINFHGVYGCKALIHIGKIAPICKFVRMYLSPNVPLKLHYTIPDLGNLFFFLSPRIEDDDGDYTTTTAAAAATQ